MKKKLFAIVLAGLLVISLLAGCSGTGTTTTTAANDGTEGTPADQTTLPQCQRRLVHDGIFNKTDKILQRIDLGIQLFQQRGIGFVQLLLHQRQRPEAPGQSQ